MKRNGAMKAIVVFSFCCLVAQLEAKPKWEYKGHPFSDDDFLPAANFESRPESKEGSKPNTSPFPSRRVGPGSWHDALGNWWLFGGQGSSAKIELDDQSKTVHFLSDLWVYSPNETLPSSKIPSSSTSPYSWKLVFRPDANSDSPYSSFPENLDFPLLCGSESSRHLALYGGHKNNPRATAESHNSPFSEDNVVWLYDIPQAFTQEKVLRESAASSLSPLQTEATGSSSGGDASNEEIRKKTVCNWSSSSPPPESCNGTGDSPQQEKQGLWTSYVCCDACLPDGNTTFEFCPQFSRDPISWCSRDSLMMLQLVLPSLGEGFERENTEKAQSSIYSTSTTTFTSGPFDKSASPSAFERHDKVDGSGEEKGNFNGDMTATTTQKVASSSFVKHQIIPKNDSIQNKMNSQATAGARRRRRSSAGEEDALRGKRGSPGSPAAGSGGSSKANFLKASQQEQKAVGQERKKRAELTESGDSGDRNGRKSEKMKRNGRDVIKDVGERKNIIASSIGQQSEKKTRKSGISNPGSSLNWWKFDLVSTEWIKMPEVNIEGELTDQVRNGNCRAVVTVGSQLVYILCPTKGNLLNRAVLLFDPEKASVQLLGTIHLNNAFTDKKVWQLGRSVLHAIRCDNQTVIFLAYHKLLDLWIHDHSSNRLYPVENVWKGSSLHSFQRTSSFYKLSISLPIPSSPKTFMKAGQSPGFLDRIDGNEEDNGSRKMDMHSTYSFFMVNPRSKLANFDDLYPAAHFHITIVPDREVFLPPRDATYLISSTEFQSDGKYSLQNLLSHDHQTENVATKEDLPRQMKKEQKVANKMEKVGSEPKPPPPPLPSLRNSRGNEPSLSQTTLQSKSNQPLDGISEHGMERGLFNSESDKKASPIGALALPIGRNLSSSNKYNGYAEKVSQATPPGRDTGNPFEPKTGKDAHDDDDDFMATTTTTLPYKILNTSSINSLSSLLKKKSNQLEEHRRNKYRMDIKSPSRKSLTKQSLVGSGQETKANMALSKIRILGVMRPFPTLTTTTTPSPTSIPSTEANHSGNNGGGGNSRTITSMPEVERTRSKFQINNTRTELQPRVAFIMRNNSTLRVGNLTNDHVQNVTVSNPATFTMQFARANPKEAENTTSISGESNTGAIGSFHREDTALAADHSGSRASNNIHSNSENLAKSHAHSGKTSSDDITLPNQGESNNNGIASNTTSAATSAESLSKGQASSRQIELENNQEKGKDFTNGEKGPALLSKMETARKKENHDHFPNLMYTDNRNSKIMMKGGNNESFSTGSITYNGARRNSSNAGEARAETATALNLPAPVRHEAPFNSHEQRKSVGAASPSTTETAAVAASSSPGLLSLGGETQTISLATFADTDDAHDDTASLDVNLKQPQEQGYYLTKEESLPRVSVQKASNKESDQLFQPANSTFSGWNQPSNLSTSLPESSGKQTESISLAAHPDDIAVTGKIYTPEIRGLDILQAPGKRAPNSMLPVQPDVTSSAAVIPAVSNHPQYQSDEGNSMYPLTGEKAVGSRNPIPSKNFIRVQGDQSPSAGYMVAPNEVDGRESQRKNDRLSSSSKHFSQDDPPSSVEDTELRVKGDNTKLSTPSSVIINRNDNYLSSHQHHQDAEGVIEGGVVDSDSLRSPMMTYGSSEMVEPRDDIMSFEHDGSLAGDTGYSSTIFFAITLSFFASIGVVLFIRRCVKCPPRRESVLIKEPPPIRYSVIPDDLSFHTPIV